VVQRVPAKRQQDSLESTASKQAGGPVDLGGEHGVRVARQRRQHVLGTAQTLLHLRQPPQLGARRVHLAALRTKIHHLRVIAGSSEAGSCIAAQPVVRYACDAWTTSQSSRSRPSQDRADDLANEPRTSSSPPPRAAALSACFACVSQVSCIQNSQPSHSTMS